MIVSLSYNLKRLEPMLTASEELLGPYPYSSFVVVIAPYGYIFLGMEYPLMNYISAAALSTSQSPAQHPNYNFFEVVAHELLHTWFGNLVTYKYIADSWISEGITSYYQKRVLGMAFNDPEITKYYLKEKAISLQSYIRKLPLSSLILTVTTPLQETPPIESDPHEPGPWGRAPHGRALPSQVQQGCTVHGVAGGALWGGGSGPTLQVTFNRTRTASKICCSLEATYFEFWR
eukprot:sb/3469376/